MKSGDTVTVKEPCLQCKKEFDFVAVYCCSGYECGCYGMPIDPPLCSKECEDKFFTLPDAPLSVEGKKMDDDSEPF